MTNKEIDSQVLRVAAELASVEGMVRGPDVAKQLGLSTMEFRNAYKRLKKNGSWVWRRWTDDEPAPCVVCGEFGGASRKTGRIVRITGRRWGLPGKLCLKCYRKRADAEHYRLCRELTARRRKHRKAMKNA